jgi:hypothetical protein
MKNLISYGYGNIGFWSSTNNINLLPTATSAKICLEDGIGCKVVQESSLGSYISFTSTLDDFPLYLLLLPPIMYRFLSTTAEHRCCLVVDIDAFSVQTRVLGSYASFVLATRLLGFTLPSRLLHIIFLHKTDCQCFSFRWHPITFLPTIKSNLNIIHSCPRKMMSKLNFFSSYR